jgi:hypothetical protein
MPMSYNSKKMIYEFGYPYINEFVKVHLKNSAWNETQLHLLVETFVNFIDVTTETFMRHGYIGSAIWIFEQLRKINAYTQQKGFHIFGEEDAVLNEIERPLLDYRILSGRSEFQPKWIRDFRDGLSLPHLLCLGKFYALNIKKLGGKDSPILEQKEQAFNIFNEILTDAIDTLKHSKEYKEAKEKGHLYYDLEANIPPDKRDPITSRLPKDKPKTDKDATTTENPSSYFHRTLRSNIHSKRKHTDASIRETQRVPKKPHKAVSSYNTISKPS